MTLCLPTRDRATAAMLAAGYTAQHNQVQLHPHQRDAPDGVSLTHVLPLPVWPYTMMVTLKPDSAASMSCLMPHIRMTSTCGECFT